MPRTLSLRFLTLLLLAGCATAQKGPSDPPARPPDLILHESTTEPLLLWGAEELAKIDASRTDELFFLVSVELGLIAIDENDPIAAQQIAAQVPLSLIAAKKELIRSIVISALASRTADKLRSSVRGESFEDVGTRSDSN